MLDLAAETMAYQAYLTAVHAHPDDEELAADLVKARRNVEIAWLQRQLDR